MGQRTYATFDKECRIVVERYDIDWASKANLYVSQGSQRSCAELDTNTMVSMMKLFAYIIKARTGELPQLSINAELFSGIIVLDANKADALYMAQCRDALDRKDGLPPVAPTPVARVRVRQREPQAATPPVSPTPEFRQRIRQR